MKYFKISLILTIIAILGVLILSCDKVNNPVKSSSKTFPLPIDSVATNIRLEVHPYGSEVIIDTIVLDTEGKVVISPVGAGPIVNPYQYYIYAFAPGFYSEIYKANEGDTIEVDLDAVPQVSNGITGVIMASQPFGSECYLIDWPITLTKAGGSASYTTRTDSSGRYGFIGIEEGHYLLHFEYHSLPFSFNIFNTSGTDYKELSFYEPIVVMAPNIYLYPESTTDVQVKVSFPDVGEIFLSEPEYNNGWDVSVTKDGLIDGKYSYLFYEAVLPNPNNHETGWVIAQADLETQFRKILIDYGFVGQEIDDFVEFWVPKLDYAPWFAFYPQDVDAMITLDITPRPDNLLRLLFYIRDLQHEIEIVEPEISQKFIRDKFTAVEWGAYGLKQVEKLLTQK